MTKQRKDVDSVAELAWDVIIEALETGKVNLAGEERVVDTGDLIDLAVKMAATKIKKPQLINKPEDFNLPVTSGEEDEKD